MHSTTSMGMCMRPRGGPSISSSSRVDMPISKSSRKWRLGPCTALAMVRHALAIATRPPGGPVSPTELLKLRSETAVGLSSLLWRAFFTMPNSMASGSVAPLAFISMPSRMGPGARASVRARFMTSRMAGALGAVRLELRPFEFKAEPVMSALVSGGPFNASSGMPSSSSSSSLLHFQASCIWRSMVTTPSPRMQPSELSSKTLPRPVREITPAAHHVTMEYGCCTKLTPAAMATLHFFSRT
mmetsp:Transcript_52000/g.111279  ORF Transcript_52000/g.111279 Transcript_52000/m.111279 type:complete len:242 (+) Transcript_52000:1548-2273(+)